MIIYLKLFQFSTALLLPREQKTGGKINETHTLGRINPTYRTKKRVYTSIHLGIFPEEQKTTIVPWAT